MQLLSAREPRRTLLAEGASAWSIRCSFGAQRLVSSTTAAYRGAWGDANARIVASRANP